MMRTMRLPCSHCHLLTGPMHSKPQLDFYRAELMYLIAGTWEAKSTD